MTAEALTLDFTKPLTIDEEYEIYSRNNPHIIGLLEDMIALLIARGATRVGIAKVVEDLRYDKKFLTNRGYDEFKFNNDFRRLYADAIIERHPEWDSIIERRKTRRAK